MTLLDTWKALAGVIATLLVGTLAWACTMATKNRVSWQ
jgi:hypothetical protein